MTDYWCLSSAGAVPYVQAFDSLLAGPVAEYLKISKEIGGDVQKHVRMFCLPPAPTPTFLKTDGFLQILFILGQTEASSEHKTYLSLV